LGDFINRLNIDLFGVPTPSSAVLYYTNEVQSGPLASALRLPTISARAR
jgi:hypothetical protein